MDLKLKAQLQRWQAVLRRVASLEQQTGEGVSGEFQSALAAARQNARTGDTLKACCLGRQSKRAASRERA
jgi:hypothetical protein